MTTDVSLRCTCGIVRGVARGVSGSSGNRVICYCDDCQSFAHFLARADEILDTHGGSDIFQMAPARIEISAGSDRLACMRLTPKGLLRWYSDCCQTPVGNTTPSSQLPFVGLLHSFMDLDASTGERDAVVGPVRDRVQGRFARGDRSTLDANDKFNPATLFRILPMLLIARLRGLHTPSPFFDSETGETSVTPVVLGAKELQGVLAARDSWGVPE